MLRTTVKSLAAHKRRLLATCSAVLLGVAFLAGMLVLGDTMTEGFSRMFTEANSGTDVVVRSSVEVGAGDFAERGTIDRALVEEVAAVDGVESAAASIIGHGRIVGADGDPVGGNGPPTYAGNWIADDDLNPYDLAEGRAPEAPGEVVIDKAAAKAGDLEVGDTTIVRTPEPVEVTIVGLATFGEADSQGPITWAAFTDEFAERSSCASPPGDEHRGRRRGGRRPGGARPAHRRRAPRGRREPDGRRADRGAGGRPQKDFLGFLRTFMLVFAGIVSWWRRSASTTPSRSSSPSAPGSPRCCGLSAPPRQVLRSAARALVTAWWPRPAASPSASGWPVLSLMEGMSMAVPGTPLAVGADTVAVAAAVGVLVTLLASIAPAVRASRVAPLAALRDVAVDRSGTSRARAVGGALAGAAGVALVVAGATGRDIGLAGIGALVTLVGVVTLGPVLARPAAGALGAPLAARSLSGALARRNAMRNPRRTAGTAAALMIGVAVVSLFTVVAASVKQSVEETVDEQFAGDLVVATDGWGVGGLPVEMAGAIAELPEVDRGRRRQRPCASTARTMSPRRSTSVLTGLFDLEGRGLAERGGRRQPGRVERYAGDNGLALGDVLQVELADGRPTGWRRAVYGNDDLLGGCCCPALPRPRPPARGPRRRPPGRRRHRGRGRAAVQAWPTGSAPRTSRPTRSTPRRGGQVDQLLTVVRHARPGDPHRPHGHRQRAVAVDPRADPQLGLLQTSVRPGASCGRWSGARRSPWRCSARCGAARPDCSRWAMVEALADEGFVLLPPDGAASRSSSGSVRWSAPPCARPPGRPAGRARAIAD